MTRPFDFCYNGSTQNHTIIQIQKSKTGIHMAKRIITLNGLKIVIMLGMLVIILSGIRSPQISSSLYFGVIYSRCAEPVVQRMVKLSHTARICGVIVIVIIVQCLQWYCW
ncbi:hypothetical protein ACNKHK_10305 [Shigella flexneri]